MAQSAQGQTVDWEQALGRVVAVPELVRPVFQPLVDLERGVVCGYEMLARFESPVKAPPPDWFAAAERHGLAGPLEALVIRAGLAAREALPANCFLTINVSPHAITTPEVRAELAAAPSLGGVVVEITEQAAVDDYEQVRSVLDLVRERGGAIAVDDAGAGYASLTHIVALRPQFVKLDRGLVTDIDVDEAKVAVIEAFGSFANRIDAWIVAEGVERTGELDALLRLGVPLGQGYGLARPAPAMGDIAPDVAAHIRGRTAAREERNSIMGLVDAVTPIELDSEPVVIAAAFAADPALTHLALVDEGSRPVALLPRAPGPAIALARRPLAVDLRSAPAEVARRAMTREPADRFEPVVCIDGRGRYVGIVRIERVVTELASHASHQTNPTEE